MFSAFLAAFLFSGGHAQTYYNEQVYSTAGSYNFTVPASANGTVSVVCVGGGGSGAFLSRQPTGCAGGGGALAYRNAFAVATGDVLTVVVGAGATTANSTSGIAGGDSSVRFAVNGTYAVYAGGGGPGRATNGSGVGALLDPFCGGSGGCPSGVAPVQTGFCGGRGGFVSANYGYGPGGGGAGGYAGAGGVGGSSGQNSNATNGGNGVNGTGGGGGGGGGCGNSLGQKDCSGTPGGGVGLFGLGTNGVGGFFNVTNTYDASTGGFGGAGSGGNGSDFGGGGGGYVYVPTANFTPAPQSLGYGGGGACRLVWPGTSRAFPSTNVAPILPPPAPPPAPPSAPSPPYSPGQGTPGEVVYSSPGIYTFTVPASATYQLSAVCVGGGGAGAFLSRNPTGCGGGGAYPTRVSVGAR